MFNVYKRIAHCALIPVSLKLNDTLYAFFAIHKACLHKSKALFHTETKV